MRASAFTPDKPIKGLYVQDNTLYRVSLTLSGFNASVLSSDAEVFGYEEANHAPCGACQGTKKGPDGRTCPTCRGTGKASGA